MRSDLKRAAKEALARAKDNPRRASEVLRKTDNDGVRAQLVRLGADQVVRNLFSSQREAAMTMAAGRVFQNMDSDKAADRLAGRIARVEFWKAYTLFGMEPLETATRESLIASAERREVQAAGELRMAKFERAIASKLEGKKQVRQCLSLSDVLKIAAKYGAKNG